MQEKQKRDQTEFSHSHILDALQISLVSTHCLCYCPSCLQSSCCLSQLITSSHPDDPHTTGPVACVCACAPKSHSRHSTGRIEGKDQEHNTTNLTLHYIAGDGRLSAPKNGISQIHFQFQELDNYHLKVNLPQFIVKLPD